eukprot:31522-Pelagococcus_subviridis.AAC.13
MGTSVREASRRVGIESKAARGSGRRETTEPPGDDKVKSSRIGVHRVLTRSYGDLSVILRRAHLRDEIRDWRRGEDDEAHLKQHARLRDDVSRPHRGFHDVEEVIPNLDLLGDFRGGVIPRGGADEEADGRERPRRDRARHRSRGHPSRARQLGALHEPELLHLVRVRVLELRGDELRGEVMLGVRVRRLLRRDRDHVVPARAREPLRARVHLRRLVAEVPRADEHGDAAAAGRVRRASGGGGGGRRRRSPSRVRHGGRAARAGARGDGRTGWME